MKNNNMLSYMATKKRCKRGFRRCDVTKTCVTTKRSRLASNNRCINGTRKCANKRCYGKSKNTRYLFNIN